MTPRRILVADDYGDSAESLAELLQGDDHEVVVARDGVEALELAEQFRPEIVLLDLAMPKMDGFMAARRIRKKPWGQAAVLIAITGWGQEDVRQRCDEAGFDAHVLKPFEYVELSKLIASFEDRFNPASEVATDR